MNRFFMLVFACTLVGAVSAQDSTYNSSYHQKSKESKKQRINRMMRMEEEGELIFNKQNIFGIHLATDGYGISFEKGIFKTNSRTLIYDFELNEKKSNKEHRYQTTDGYNINSFIVGKLNNFFQFKASIGEERLIGGKGNKNGVRVTGLYTGGVSLGILKPYMINYADSNGNIDQSTYPALFAKGEQADITGASGFFTGWSKMSVTPGINAKTALRFDYGKYNQVVSAVEVGLTGEYYFSKIPQVFLVPEKHFFLNGYVAILFGSRK